MKMTRPRRCLRLVAVIALMAIAPLFMSPDTRAEDKTVLIVKIEDSESSELASKLYQNVVLKISQHLEKAGFQTFNGDERLPDAESAPGSLSDADLLMRIRENNDKQIDYVAIVQIFANTVLLSEGTRIEVEITGRMLKTDNGDVLARFDLPVPNSLNASPSCDRQCIVKLLEDNTNFLADSLGQLLAKRLQSGQ